MSENYKKVDDIEERLKRGAKKVAVGGLLMLSGFFAKDIKTHTTYEQMDNGHYANAIHTEGAGKTIATLGAAAFLALGATKKDRHNTINMIKKFTQER